MSLSIPRAADNMISTIVTQYIATKFIKEALLKITLPVQFRMSYVTITILLTVAAIAPVSSVQTMLDSFSYCNSSGIVECTARVRKVNRTTAALYGKFLLNTELDSSHNVRINVIPAIKKIHFQKISKTFRQQWRCTTARWVTASSIATR
uniref:(northern house mosquito) hypothetical protein n=1 Tax=Culex pipiens TaxID=7175 RepID=A0A8D8AWN1_CULPI